MAKIRIGYITGTSGDWGGAGRVIFSIIKNINKDLFEPVVFLPSEGPITATLDRDGIRYCIYNKKHTSIAAHLLDVFKIIKLLKQEKIQLVHLNYYNWRTPEILAAKALRIPVVIHYHTPEPSDRPYLKLADRIITVSDYCKQTSKPRSVKKTTIHNTVDLEKFINAKDIREEIGFKREEVIVTFIGQIKRIKGIEIFLKLAESIDQGNIKFLIAGEIREPGYLEEFNEKLEKLSNTTHLGYIKNIEDIFLTSDIIVVPSIWEEPFGLINIEAGAASKPVIATNTGGIPEIIVDGFNGYLYEKNDLTRLIKTTKELANSRESRIQVGKNAFEHVKQNFTTKPIEKLEYEYIGLVKK